MSERALTEPLSGAEIIDGICYQVRQELKRDCYLNEASAYEVVMGTIRISLAMKDCGRTAEVDTRVKVAVGSGDAGVPVESTVAVDPKPPNQVRLDTDQAIPTLVESGDGKREVKRVSYAKPQRRGLTPAQQVARDRAGATGGTADVDLGPGVGGDDAVPMVSEGDTL